MLALQLKATVNLNPLKTTGGDIFSFRLKAANYEWLREPSQVPRLLVVLDMPEAEEHWITVTTEELVLRRCAYWLNLHGASPATVIMPTVHVPKSQVFDVAALQMLMEESRQGSL